MQRISEQTSLRIAASFYDDESAQTVPASAQYRIDDEASGTNILGWTPLTPAASVVIATSAAQNAVLNRSNLIERRVVTVQTTDSDGMNSDAYIYEIARLEGLNS